MENVFLTWIKPMTSQQAAHYLLTKGFVAAELYDALRTENKRLKEALDCATNNQWSEWELERGKIKGENWAKDLEIIKLKARLKPIEEAWEEWKRNPMKDFESRYDDFFEAIRKCMEMG